MALKRLLVLLVLSAAALNGCMDDDKLWNFERLDVTVPSGVFIVNEGNFMYGNASLSFYNVDSMTVRNDVFYETNGLTLGDMAQFMAIRDSLGYIVINNSGKIYVINVNTFKYVGKITGLTSPRSIHFIDKHKAYVTDIYARRIWIVDPLGSYEQTGVVDGGITGFIDVNNQSPGFYQHPTDQMVQYKQYVFTNCQSYDNQILVIDSETDRLVDSIKMLIQPSSLAIDRYNKIWVGTDGGYEGSPYGYEAPGLIRIDAETREIEQTIRFEPGDRLPQVKLNGDKDIVYFINRHIYRMPVLGNQRPEIFIESPNAGFYGLDIDPASGDVYVTDAIDYVQPGLVYRYRANGTPVDTFKAGIIPGAFCFK